jgi:hypothetical protein
VSRRDAPFLALVGSVLTDLAGIVVVFAVGAAAYSSLRHFMTDKTIRFKRQNRAADSHTHGEHH